MSLVKCAVRGCPHHVRQGLKRGGCGVDGQELADGYYCWRCRAKHARDHKNATRDYDRTIAERENDG